MVDEERWSFDKTSKVRDWAPRPFPRFWPACDLDQRYTSRQQSLHTGNLIMVQVRGNRCFTLTGTDFSPGHPANPEVSRPANTILSSRKQVSKPA